jgi:TPR repeat protein
MKKTILLGVAIVAAFVVFIVVRSNSISPKGAPPQASPPSVLTSNANQMQPSSPSQGDGQDDFVVHTWSAGPLTEKDQAAADALNKHDFKTAFELYSELYVAGNPDGTLGLAQLYLSGSGVERNFERAKKLLPDCAVKGYPPCEYNIGVLSGSQWTDNPDLPGAFGWMLKAAEHHYLKAYVSVARDYLSGQGIPQNPAQGQRWLERAAKATGERLDHPVSKPDADTSDVCFSLGAYFESVQDYQSAVRWYDNSVKRQPSNYNSYFRLGTIYALHMGLWDRGVNEWRKAAELGNGFAYAFLAQTYSQGWPGHGPDPVEGCKWTVLAEESKAITPSVADPWLSKCTFAQVADAKRWANKYSVAHPNQIVFRP